MVIPMVDQLTPRGMIVISPRKLCGETGIRCLCLRIKPDSNQLIFNLTDHWHLVGEVGFEMGRNWFLGLSFSTEHAQ